jgi:aspartate/methionine/tyrosine aminotransferase
MQISNRAQRIEPFYVMEVAKAARLLGDKLLNTERPMLYLNVGEPDFTAPPLVQEAAISAVKAGNTQYTQASGMPELRERISLVQAAFQCRSSRESYCFDRWRIGSFATCMLGID